jgi:hypothetical protein
MSIYDDKIRQDAGIPLLYGNIGNVGPSKVFFVNPTIGSDANPGTKMEKPFSTISAAYSACTSSNHDLIVLSANAAHAATDELATSKNRVHFLGLDAVGRYYGQRTRWTMGVTTGTAIAIVQNTGVGNTFQNIKFDSSDTLSTSKYVFAEGGEYTVLENCELYQSGQLGVATGAELLMNGDSALVRACTIGSLAAQVTDARTNVLLTRETIAGKVCRDVTFDDCLLWLKSSSATASHFHATTATDVERMLLIKNCAMVVAKLSGATVGDAIIVGATQTEGQILVQNSYNYNSTALGTTGSVGIFYAGAPVATAATAGNAIAVTD